MLHVLPVAPIDQDNNEENTNLIHEDSLVDDPPHHDVAEYNENNNDASEDEATIDIANLRSPPGDNERETYLLHFLKEWGVRGVAFKKLDELLAGLRVLFPGLPKSHKSLFDSRCIVNIKKVGQGLLWYKGIKINLAEVLTDNYVQENNEILMDVNIDGVELYKSADDQFWPILGCLKGNNYPFIISVWYGHSKPNNLEGYLSDFIEEVRDLTNNGYNFHGNNIVFRIHNYILDAPARQFVKAIQSHNSTFACEKCTVRGVRYKGREIFLDNNAALRTDEAFHNRQQPEHHKGDSPLEDLQTKMVSEFRLEPMHLVYAGVFKRWLHFLFDVVTIAKINNRAKYQLAIEMLHCSTWVPLEFNRRPRSIYEMPKYKATEMRRILLYDGVRIFKDTLPVNTYKNYLLLHCGIYILSNPILVQDPIMLHAAENILEEFVRHSTQIFGRSFVVYNVHSLLHLVDECRNHGTLESFSAFKYENFLGVIKRYLRSAYKPLQQLIKRDGETKGRLIQKKDTDDSENIILQKQHNRDGNVDGEQFQIVILCGVTLKRDEANSCFKTKSGDVIILDNISKTFQNQIFLIGYRFTKQENYYDFPIPSSKLGILKVSHLEKYTTAYRIKEFFCKCVIFPDNETFVCIPLVHCNN